MKTVRITEPGKISVENTEEKLPECKKDEALLRVRYCGICGADVEAIREISPLPHIRE